MISRGRPSWTPDLARLMKWVSIRSVPVKSAMTPALSGRTAFRFGGVRPNMACASVPTATTSSVAVSIATIDGSLSTMPRPRIYTYVFAVPKSMAMSFEKRGQLGIRDPLWPLP